MGKTSRGFTEADLRPRVRSLDLSAYPHARYFFDAVRDAAEERDSIRLAVDQMEAREGARAQTYAERVSVGGERDRMAQTDARIDYEDVNARIYDEDSEMLRFAETLIWGGSGGDMSGGVLRVMGLRVASMMEAYYVHHLGWREVSRRFGYSPEHCRRIVYSGLDAIDFLGWSGIVPGTGIAQT